MGILVQDQVTLLTNYDAASTYSVAYNAIYNNIRFAWDTEQNRQYALLLTTPAAYAGRVAAPTNLAIAAAQNGTPTLLVDADLHSPSLQQYLGTGEKSGLSDLLTGESINTRTLQPHLSKTFIPGLSLLCAGSAVVQRLEISRLLTMRLGEVISGLRQFLQETERQPGMIIFNSPPVLSGIDAALISAAVDQTFLVIASARTTRMQARKAQAQLERAHAKLAGAIMLDV